MNLVVDYGNTFTKVGVFAHDELKEHHTFAEQQALKRFVQNFPAENFILSSVTHEGEEVMHWVEHIKQKYILTHTLPLPIKNRYATPETLGVDRIAGVCGAHQRFPHMNCLVIDAGTCITYDFIDRREAYQGGSIAPGLQMRFQAMNVFTARLPLAKVTESPPLIGDTTETCLQSGAINGMIQEIDGIIGLYRQKFEALQVILCGGDAGFFENKLKGPIFAIPELVLSGLNSILIYNVGH